MQGDPVVEQATAAPGEHRNINKTHAIAQAARYLLAACDHDVATALAAVEKAAAR